MDLTSSLPPWVKWAAVGVALLIIAGLVALGYALGLGA